MMLIRDMKGTSKCLAQEADDNRCAISVDIYDVQRCVDQTKNKKIKLVTMAAPKARWFTCLLIS